MAKKITRQEISESDVFGDLGKSALSAEEKIMMLSKALEELQKTSKGIGNKVSAADPKSLKDLEELNKLLAQTTKLSKDRTVIDKQIAQQQKEISSSTQQVSNNLKALSLESDKLRKQRIALNKAEKAGLISQKEASAQRAKLNVQLKKSGTELNKLIKEEAGLVSAIDKERASLNKMIKARQSLALVSSKNTKESRALDRQIRKTDASIKKAENTTKGFGFSFRNLSRNVKQSIISFKDFAKGLILFRGVQALGSAFRNAFKTVVDFQKANADLAGVLGKTRKEIKALTTDAKRLGSSTIFTASQVTKLQKEYAKLGFAQEEILNVTEATLTLATATNTELPRAAEVVGSTLRAFQLDSSETERVVDLMTKSFNSSALDMEKFSTAMSTVAPVANNAGVSIERTTALLGTLVDNGIDASTAGTGLRNIFLELAKSGQTFEGAMSKINKSTDKNATALQLFGKRGAAVATILSNNTEKTNELNSALLNAGGTAEEVAREQMDTLSGSISQLSSSYEGFILSLEDGDGALSKAVRGVVDLFSNILDGFRQLSLSSSQIIDENVANIGKTGENFGKSFVNGIKKGQDLTSGEIIKLISQLEDQQRELSESSSFEDLQSRSLIQGQIASLKQLQSLRRKNSDLNDEEERFLLISNALNKASKLRAESERELNNVRVNLGNKSAEEAKKISEQSLKNFEADKQREEALQVGLRDNLRKLDELALKGIAQKSKANISALAKEELARRKIKDLNPEEKSSSGRSGSRGGSKPESEKELTRLQELQKQLKENRELAQQLATEDTLESDERLVNLNNIGFALQDQIKKIKDLIALKRQDKNEFEKAQAADVTSQAQLDNESVQEQLLQDEQDLLIEFREKKIAGAFETNEELIAAEEELQRQLLDIKIQALKSEQTLLKIGSAESKKITAEVLELEIERSKIGDKSEEKAAEEAKRLEARADLRRVATETFTDFFVKQADKRISKIDEEISAAQRQAGILAGLAQSGNIEAQQSLAQQDQIIAEANLRKERLEKRKQRILLASSIIQAYNSELAQGTGSGEAFTKAITSTTVLQQFISALPTFFEGTESTGKQGRGVDGKGGFLSVLHEDERVVPKKFNDKIGTDISNEDLAGIVENYRNNRFSVELQKVAVVKEDNNSMKQELIDIKQAIIDKPETNIELGAISQTQMEIIERKKTGSAITTNVFKVKS